MKRVLIALTWIFGGIAHCAQDRPQQIRVCLQFIEVPHSTLTEILADREKSGQALHEKAVALSKDGQGKILETCMVVCLSGQKASLESIREEIYPTEYTPPELPCGGTPESRLTSDTPMNPFFRQPTAFETRNAGVTFEVESTLASNGAAIDLRLSPEIITPLRLETWMEHVDQWGDGSIRMPIYETWKVQSSVRVEPGRFELVSALTPKANAPVPAVSRKILVFVRADILTVP